MYADASTDSGTYSRPGAPPRFSSSVTARSAATMARAGSFAWVEMMLSATRQLASNSAYSAVDTDDKTLSVSFNADAKSPRSAIDHARMQMAYARRPTSGMDRDSSYASVMRRSRASNC